MKCCKFCSRDPQILGATTQNLVSWVTCAQDLYAPVADCVLFNGRVTSDLGGKHSFIPLAGAEYDNTLPFSGASSFPVCYIPFPATLFHQLVFHPPSLHLAIYFFLYLSALLLPNSYIILFWEFYLPPFSVHAKTSAGKHP